MVQAGEHADLSEILVQIEMPVEAEREISRLFSCAKGEKMGGRGSSFKKSGGGKTGTVIPAKTEEEFLREKGVGSAFSGNGIDRYGGANMTRMSERQRRKTLSQIDKMNDDYYARRDAARSQYKDLVASGKLRDKTRLERVIESAHGHPDNKSTQAARRMAEKMGYDWKTGKKLNRQ